MTIGFIGLGKLGYPVAMMMAGSGRKVIGYDINSAAMSHGSKPYREAGLSSGHSFEDLQRISEATMTFGPIKTIAKECDPIFLAIQTPHAEEFDGAHPLPSDREDFDYSYLKDACHMLAGDIGIGKTVVIISTVLPGTIRREILPIFEGLDVTVVYNPQFIAMGTVVKDYCDPEFLLLGSTARKEDAAASDKVAAIHRRVHHYALRHLSCNDMQERAAPIRTMSIESAELTKVAYNTMIGMKVAFANTIGELSDRIGSDCDDVMDTLKLATDRLISPSYLTPGMGDGGGCHPRDNIAMSWLADKHSLSFDFFSAIMEQREKHATWLAVKWMSYADNQDLPLVLCGTAFKPETDLEDGSPALLVKRLAEDRMDNPLTSLPTKTIHVLKGEPEMPACYFIGCKHAAYADIQWPKGSAIIDPFRYIADQDGVTVRRIGEGG